VRRTSSPLARTPRDAEDRLSWITIDDNEICSGCLTVSDAERLRTDNRSVRKEKPPCPQGAYPHRCAQTPPQARAPVSVV
jgi:hypothetical protein